jgi:hypothetical protein
VVVAKDCAVHCVLLTPKDPLGEPAERLSKRMAPAHAGGPGRASATKSGKASRKTVGSDRAAVATRRSGFTSVPFAGAGVERNTPQVKRLFPMVKDRTVNCNSASDLLVTGGC